MMNSIKQILIWTFAIVIAICMWPIIILTLTWAIHFIIIGFVALWIAAMLNSRLK